ncbi:MAG: tetratricopeptide repeat protein [Termitinemataceae bacterium]
MRTSTYFIASLIVAAIMVLSCTSAPIVIDDTLTPMELVQRAQDATDKNQYSAAMQYYQAILDRYPKDIDMVCAAEYEIAFLYYKQKKYTPAKERFRALLQRYEAPDADFLPLQYKILAEKVLAKIELDGLSKH